MNGRTARLGFGYQDSYLLMRVLEDVRDGLSDAWENGIDDAIHPVRFGIEANTRYAQPAESSGEPNLLDWDVFIRIGPTTELTEVKSGTVRKSDRRAFWLRLRRELGATNARVHPALVVDPDKISDLATWQGLASSAV